MVSSQFLHGATFCTLSISVVAVLAGLYVLQVSAAILGCSSDSDGVLQGHITTPSLVAFLVIIMACLVSVRRVSVCVHVCERER